MNRRLFAIAGLLIVAIPAARPLLASDEPAPPKGLAKSIRVEFPKAGSVENVLHIRKGSGTFALSRKVSNAALVIDLYRDGAKVKSDEIGLAGLDESSGSFSVHVIDLDYLPLGGPQPGHVRIQASLEMGNTTGVKSFDVAKKVFGGAMNSHGSQAHTPDVATGNDAPLFYLIPDARPDERGGITQAGGNARPERIAAMNKTSDVLVARLVVDPREAK